MGKAKPIKVNKKRQESQRNASARYRESIRNHPVKYETYKAKDRQRKAQAKEEGKLKTAAQLSKRQLKIKRARNRVYMRNYRARNKKQTEDDLSGVNDFDDTPSTSDHNGNYSGLTPNKSISTKKKVVGRKAVRKDRAKAYVQIKLLQKKLTSSQREVWRLRRRETRKRKAKTSPDLSPKKKLQKLSGGRFLKPEVRKELFKGLVLQEECRNSLLSLDKERKNRLVLSRLLNGRIVKKYKLLNQFQDIFPRVSSLKGRKWAQSATKGNVLTVNFRQTESEQKKSKAIIDFFVSDIGSYPCPGKKDFVIVNGEKVQKRYLTDTMSSLYPKFLNQSPFTVGFSTFCRYKPPYVVKFKLSGRSTCLCTKCDNFKLLVSCLQSAGVISGSTKNDVISQMCCDTNCADCMLRTCSKCKSNSIKFNVQNKSTNVTYYKWVRKTVAHRKNPDKTMPLTSKDAVETTVQECVNVFKEMLPVYMTHIGRVMHQRSQWNNLQANLTEKDLLLLVDWSESWECKYFEEVQPMHFGGSHKQLSLHTGLAKRRAFSQTFCTVSMDTSHGPKFIYAHLKPILLKYATEKITHVHIWSDGPTTQYRSANMFYVVANYFSGLLKSVNQITWNFSESGHGKNVADGVGGTIKRTADNVVSYRTDIVTIDAFVTYVSRRCPSIDVLEVPVSQIQSAYDLELPALSPFKGTMKVHQYHWYSSKPAEIRFKTLSCYCSENENTCCDHFSMGPPWIIKATKKTDKTVSVKAIGNKKDRNAKKAHPPVRKNPEPCINPQTLRRSQRGKK